MGLRNAKGGEEMEYRPEDKREAGEVTFRRGEKLQAGEIKADSKFMRWLDNYWYHYKWPTIFVAIALICVIVIIVQLTERKEYDYRFVYAGPVSLSEKQAVKMADELAKLGVSAKIKSPEALLTPYFLKHASDIKAEDAYYAQMMDSNRTALQQQILAGDALIFLMDPKLFLQYEEADAGFLPVRDYCSDAPDSALTEGSECGLRLDATVLWERECFRVLPGDTVVCLRTPVAMSSLLDQEKALAYHDRYEELFSKLCQP